MGTKSQVNFETIFIMNARMLEVMGFEGRGSIGSQELISRQYIACFNWTKGLPEVLSFILHPAYAVARIFHISSMPMICPKQIPPPLSWKPVFPGVSDTNKHVRGKATRRAQMSIAEGLLEGFLFFCSIYFLHAFCNMSS